MFVEITRMSGTKVLVFKTQIMHVEEASANSQGIRSYIKMQSGTVYETAEDVKSLLKRLNEAD